MRVAGTLTRRYDVVDMHEFRDAALAGGFRSIHCVPLRVQGQVLGTLNLLRTEAAPLAARDEHLAQLGPTRRASGRPRAASSTDPSRFRNLKHNVIASQASESRAAVTGHEKSPAADCCGRALPCAGSR